MLKKSTMILLLFLFGGWFFSGCGSTESESPVFVTIRPGEGGQTPRSGFFMLPTRGKVTFEAEVSGSLNPAVIWRRVFGSGTIDQENNKVIFTAPDILPGGRIEGLEAESVENPEASEFATVRVTRFEEPPGQVLSPIVDEIIVGGLPFTPSQTLDFNGDGNIDVASRNYLAEKVTFHLVDPPNPAVPGGELSFTGKEVPVTKPVFLIVGDFVNDLDPDNFLADIAVLSQDTDGIGGEVVFISGNKTDNLAAFNPVTNAVTLPIPTGTPKLLVGGRFHDPPETGPFTPVSDLAVGTHEGEVIIFLQDRNPDPGSLESVHFGPAQTVSIGGNLKQFLEGDFNGDGRKEIAVVREVGRDLTLILGDQSDNFSSQPIPMLFPAPVESLVSEDFNGDGISDIIAAHSSPDQLSIFLGNPSGSFLNTGTLPLTFPPGKMAVGDYNLGGNIDIAVTDPFNNKIQLFFGDGSGQFIGEWQSQPASFPPFSLISGSFSGFPATIGFQDIDLIYLAPSSSPTSLKIHVLSNKDT